MRELRSLVGAARAMRGNAQPLLLATVVEVDGPAYRRPGARMLVAETGVLAGSVSGGCLERDIVNRGFWRTRAGQATLVTYDASSDEKRGSGCDGVVRVLLQRADATCQTDPLVVAERCVSDEMSARLVTVIRSRNPAFPVGARVVRFDGEQPYFSAVAARPERSSPPDPLAQDGLRSALLAALDHDGAPAAGTFACRGFDAFVERISAPPHLFLFGTAHDAHALLLLAKQLGWSVTVCTDDARATTRARFAEADRVLVGDAATLVRSVNRAARPLAVIMGHHYQNDLAALGVLLSSRALYIGLLGARTRAARILEDAGIAPDFAGGLVDARLHAPVGLDIAAEGPAEIALSILAEAQAVLHGASGQRRSAAAVPNAGGVCAGSSHARATRAV